MPPRHTTPPPGGKARSRRGRPSTIPEHEKTLLQRMREDRGLTQAELGLKIGKPDAETAQSFVTKLERNPQRLSGPLLQSLAEALECHPLDLTDDVAGLSRADLNVLRVYFHLNTERREIVVKMIENLAAETKKAS